MDELCCNAKIVSNDMNRPKEKVLYLGAYVKWSYAIAAYRVGDAWQGRK